MADTSIINSPIRIVFDNQGRPEDPTLILAKRNGKKIGVLNAKEIDFKDVLRDAFEINFRLYKYNNDQLDPMWEDVKNFRLVWWKEQDAWFEIKVDVDEATETIKTVYGVQLGKAELSEIKLYDIQINTESDIERDDYIPTTLYNEDEPEASLLDRILEKAPHYSIKHVDDSIKDIQRTFEFNNVSIYDAFQQVAEEIQCLFIYSPVPNSVNDGNIKREISVYDALSHCSSCGYRGEQFDVCPECGSTNIVDGYGDDTTIFITAGELHGDELANNISLSSDTDSIRNCYKLDADDDLMTATIRNANPNGSDYIWFFSEDMLSDVSPELRTKLLAYSSEYDRILNDEQITLDSGIVSNYNILIDKYQEFDPDLETIQTTNYGYHSIMKILYDTLDFDIYLSSALMPDVSMEDTSADDQIELLEDTIDFIAVVDDSNIAVETASNAYRQMAKALLDFRYDIKVVSASLTTSSGVTRWEGTISVTNVSDEDDTATTTVLVPVTDDYEEFIKQKIEKVIGKTKVNDTSVSALFAMEYNDFVLEIKKYCKDSLSSFESLCQSVIDIIVEQGITAGGSWAPGNSIYDDIYMPYKRKLGAIETELAIREGEIKKINALTDSIRDISDAIKTALNLKDLLGDTLWEEFSSYRREDIYEDNNYSSDNLSNAEMFASAMEFIERARNDIKEKYDNQYSISTSLKNLLHMPRFLPITDHFSIGNWMRIVIDGRIYKLRLTEYTINFDDFSEISVVFSQTALAKSSSTNGILTSLQKSIYQATQKEIDKQASDTNAEIRNITNIINNLLDDVNRGALNGENGLPGKDGRDGASAVAYSLSVSCAAIVRGTDTAFTPSTLTLTGRAQTENEMSNYAGRFVIEKTTDYSTWTTIYTSSSDEATKSFDLHDPTNAVGYAIVGEALVNDTLTPRIMAFRCSLYRAGGTTTLVDQQTIPVVADGKDGKDGSDGRDGADGGKGDDGYTVMLGNENHTFVGDEGKALQSSITFDIVSYKGTTAIAPTNVTYSGNPTGMTITLSSNKKTVTISVSPNGGQSMTSANGVVTFSITVDGKVFTKKFTYSIAFAGQNGANGEDAIVIAFEATKTKQDNIMVANITAHVWKGATEITDTTTPSVSDLGVLNWYSSTDVDGQWTEEPIYTGGTLTVSPAVAGIIYDCRLVGDDVLARNSISMDSVLGIGSVNIGGRNLLRNSDSPADHVVLREDCYVLPEGMHAPTGAYDLIIDVESKASWAQGAWVEAGNTSMPSATSEYPQWNSNTTYDEGQKVYYNNAYYVSKASGNTDKPGEPVVSTPVTTNRVLGEYELVSGSFSGSGGTYFAGLTGKGHNATQTTSNYYAPSGVTTIFKYNVGMSVPSGYTIGDVYALINGHPESYSNANELLSVRFKSGDKYLSEEYNFKSLGTNTNTTITLSCDAVPTREEIENLEIECKIGHYGGAINGATIYVVYYETPYIFRSSNWDDVTVELTPLLDAYPGTSSGGVTIHNNSNGDAFISQEYMPLVDGQTYTLSYYARVNSEHMVNEQLQPVPVTSLVMLYDDALSGVTSSDRRTLGPYTRVSGNFSTTNAENYFSGLGGDGINPSSGAGADHAQTTTNYNSSGSGQIVVFKYAVPFNSIPSNARISRVYCEVNGHAQSTSNSTEYMTVQLKSGNTNLSSQYNFKSSSTSNQTRTIECTTIPTIAQLQNMELECTVGYYGGAINGATIYVVYDADIEIRFSNQETLVATPSGDNAYDNEWHKFEHTFIYNEGNVNYNGIQISNHILGMRFGISGSGWIDYCAMQLEVGNIATNWNQAPEDAVDFADKIRSDIDGIDGRIEEIIGDFRVEFDDHANLIRELDQDSRSMMNVLFAQKSYTVYNSDYTAYLDTNDLAQVKRALIIDSGGIGFWKYDDNASPPQPLFNPETREIIPENLQGNLTSVWTLDGKFDAEAIEVVNLSASSIAGGCLVIGGKQNVENNGIIEVYGDTKDASDLIARIDRAGIKVFAKDGTYVLMDGNVGFAGYDPSQKDDQTYTSASLEFPAWSSSKQYGLGERVFYNGKHWMSTVTGNINSQPRTDSVNWKIADLKIFWADKDEFHMRKAVVEEEITMSGKLRFIPITILNNGQVVNDGVGLVAL